MNLNSNVVTIIIPVYNEKKYLERCIRSVVNQTYKNLDIILIDDGSTDGSGRICKNYEAIDSRIKYIYKENAGLGMARNTGLENSSGDYVLFIDSDDYIEPEMVEKLLEKAVNENVDLVISNFIYNGNVEHNSLPEKVYTGSINVKSILIHMMGNDPGYHDGMSVTSCAKLYNLKILKENNIYFPSERKLIWEDCAFNLNVFPHLNAIYLMDNAYYHYNYMPNSLTHSYNPNKLTMILKMYDYVVEKTRTLGIYENAKDRINYTYSGHIRTCLKLIVFFSHKTGKKKTISHIKETINNKRVQYIISSVPLSKQNMSQKIYSKCIKKKCVLMVYFLTWMQNNRKNII